MHIQEDLCKTIRLVSVNQASKFGRVHCHNGTEFAVRANPTEPSPRLTRTEFTDRANPTEPSPRLSRTPGARIYAACTAGYVTSLVKAEGRVATKAMLEPQKEPASSKRLAT